MKAPDKIYLEKFPSGVLRGIWNDNIEDCGRNEPIPYIRKDALIKWMQNEIDSIYCGRQYVGVSRDETIEVETLQKVIDKLNSM